MSAPIPPELTTAHLLLRGLVPALAGCPIGADELNGGNIEGGVRAGAFQMTYRKDLPKLGRAGGLTGKLSWNLGKKYGAELSAHGLPKGEDNPQFDAQCEEFWTKLEGAANRLISENNMSVTKCTFASEDAALETLGRGVLDAGQCGARDKRRKKAEKAAKEGKAPPAEEGPVAVGHIKAGSDTFALALLHGTELVPLSRLGSIQILRENPKNESNIVCTKKKCEVTVKFCVMPLEEDGGEAMDVAVEEGAVENLSVAKCTSRKIRVQEGLDYQVYLQQMAMEALSAASPAEEGPAGNGDAAAAPKSDEMVVNAFEVSGSIDYGKLIEQFGSKPLTPYLLRRLENVTVKRGTVPRLHRFLRREIFFSHRDIERICELLEGWYGVAPPPEDDAGSAADDAAAPVEWTEPSSPCPIYLYTGRGPSSAAMHLGHLVPFLFTAWLQKAFRCPLVIQMTDDEKFLFKGEYSSEASGDGTGTQPNRTGDNLDRFADLTIENAKDIVACDFIKEKTFLFSDLEYVGRMYPNIVRIWKAVTVNQVNGVFGFDGTSNIGKAAFPAIQAAPSFGSSFPNVLGNGRGAETTLACLIPCAIDQDPYFRLTRDVAHKLVPRHHPLGGKPALIHSKFFPPLQGAQGKMSSSDANSAIFLTDAPGDIERKIKENALSGGRETKKLQEELGADLDVDVSYQWLRFFLEDDDELARIGREYGSGSGEYWNTAKVKARLVEVLKELVGAHQARRARVTEEVVREWMAERCIIAEATS
ncbi:hypothetical protein ACHAXT_000075 [Thalassiosira profunda]